MIHNSEESRVAMYDGVSDRAPGSDWPRLDLRETRGRLDCEVDTTRYDTILISSPDYARLKLDLLGIFRLKWLSQ